MNPQQICTRSHRLLVKMCLCAAAMLFTTQANCQLPSASVSASAAVLTGDARLQQKVTLDEMGITLSQLLHRLSMPGLTLACTRASAEQKLMLCVRNRPLYNLLQSLALLLPGAWERDADTKGYVLRMANAAVQKRDRWWQLYLGERERTLSELSGLMLTKMRASLKPGPATANSELTPEQARQMQTQNVADRAFYNLLPAPLQEQIASHIDMTRFYNVWMFPGSSSASVGTSTLLNTLPADVQQRVRQKAPQLPPGADAPLLFINNGTTVSPSVLLPDKARTYVGPDLHIPDALPALTLYLDHGPLAAQAKRLGRAAPAAWKPFLAYQQQRFWQNDVPLPSANYNRTVPRRRADVLRWLAKQAKIEYVSDYYSTLGSSMLGKDSERSLSRPLKAELDAYAAEADLSWQQNGDGLYLFRSNRWYRDDLLEVNDARLQAWLKFWLAEAPKDAIGSSSFQPTPEMLLTQLNWEAEVIQNLTPWQVANGLAYFTREPGNTAYDPNMPPYALRPFNDLADHVMAEYDTAQFYAALSAEQRRLLAHNRLPAAALTDQQRKQAAQLLPELQTLAPSTGADAVLIGLKLPDYSFRIRLVANPGALGSHADIPQIWPVTLTTFSPIP